MDKTFLVLVCLPVLLMTAMESHAVEHPRIDCSPATELRANQLRDEIGKLKQQKKWSDATPLARCLVEVAQQLFGRDRPTTVNLMRDLAMIMRAAGQTTEAAEIEKRIDATSGSKVDRNDIMDIELLMVRLKSLLDRGDTDQAGHVCIEASQLAVSRGVVRNISFSVVTNECGRVFEAYGNYEKAETLYRESIRLARELGGAHVYQWAAPLSNLGLLYWKIERFQEAIAPLEEAIEISGAENPENVPTMNNLGLVFEALGRHEEAREMFLGARDLMLRFYGTSHPELVAVFDNLAAQSWRAEHIEEAIEWQQKANQVAEHDRVSMLILGSERQKLAYLTRLRESTHASVTLSLVASKKYQRAVALGAEATIQGKGRVLDTMADAVARLRQSVKPEDRRLFDQFASIAQQLSTLIHQGPGKTSPDIYRARLTELSAKQEQWETDLSKGSTEFRQQTAPITLAAVQAALPHDTVLLEWFRYAPFDIKAKDHKAKWGQPRYVAYLLRHEGEPTVVDVGDAEAIERLVMDLLAALRQPGQLHTMQILSKELDRLLLQPLRPYLGETRQLLLSPDGQLNLLPFAILQDAQGRTLIEQYELTYLTSGRDLLQPDGRVRKSQPTLVLADPDFGPLESSKTILPAQGPRPADLTRSGLRFKSLKGTAQEAEALRTLLHLNENQVLTQQRASETALKQVHGPRILHLATHGFFLDDLPVDLNASARSARGVGLDEDLRPPVVRGENPLLRSGLALAGANQLHSGADDGILTALEVASLDLQGTELAVLSACETAVGQVHNGEGVYGLRRALVLAGVQTQVASLWKVDDTATTEFMVAYYQHLQAGLGRSASLRAVQRSMKENPKRAHPYYWAAFVVIGDASPLPDEHISPTTMVPK